MKLRTLIFSIGLVILIFFSAFAADDDPFTALLKKLDEFAKKYPQEKVHLHLDKPYYAIGDNIWFKAYVTDSRTSLPTTTSNILYVELINDNDSVTTQLKLPMQSGITWGDFKLPDTLKEGNYRLRAYTQWMRNAGPNFFFDKTIKIGNAWANKVYTKTSFQYSNQNDKETLKATIQFLNASASPFPNAPISYRIILGNKKIEDKATTDNNGEINISLINNSSSAIRTGYILATIDLPNGLVTKKIPIKTLANLTDVQFFPESGSLIEGIPCKVAIKATNANGLGEDVKGIILDNEGIEVLAFETSYLGMGTFALNPMAGKTYSAKVKLANGDEKIVALPKAEKSGYSLAVNNQDSLKMNIKVMLTPDLLNSGSLNLVAHHYGKVLFMGKIPTEKQVATVIVPKTEFPSGIIQLTLFNAQQLPVCERLAFVNNIQDKIDVKFESLHAAYDKKSLVNIDLLFKNGEKPSQGSFSVAVTNAKMVEPDLENESNILTGLLLTSDLSGYIEKPNHYFLGNDAKTFQELDQLLLTQGWRRIDWNAVSSSSPTAIGMPVNSFQAEKAMKISGVVTNNGKPIAKAKVSLMSSSNGIFATETETDANGRFIFDHIAFNDSTSFALKAVANGGHKGVKIVLDEVPSQIVTANKNSGDVEINVNQAIKNYIQESVVYFNDQESKGFLNRTNQLKAVEIIAKANKASPLSTNFNGPGKADAVFDAEDLKNTTSFDDYLQGRVTGIERYKGKWYLTKNNPGMGDSMPGKVNGPEPMRIYINGVEMTTDPEFTLADIEPLEIESLEILKSIANTTLYGTTAGVMLFTTKTAKERTIFNTRAPGMLPYHPKGFYTVRQFYSPKYDVSKDDKPDYRPTILWEPNLVADANGKANLNYYNTDQTGPVRIVIEGIDGDGNLARKVLTYEVK